MRIIVDSKGFWWFLTVFDNPSKKGNNTGWLPKSVQMVWTAKSGPNLVQIWTESGHHLDRFFKNGYQNSWRETLPRYEGINFGFRFIWEILILSVPRLCTYKGRRNLGPFLNYTTTKIPFVCTFTYEQRNEPIGPFLSCFMCIYIRRKMHSGPVQNGLDQSRIWTACPDMPSRFFDLDRGVPRSGPDLDQIWTKSGPNLESSKNRLDQFQQPPTVDCKGFLRFLIVFGGARYP